MKTFGNKLNSYVMASLKVKRIFSLMKERAGVWSVEA